MTRPRRALVVLLAALAAASPVSAALPDPPAETGPIDDAAFRPLIASALAAAQANDCRAVLRLLDPALPRLEGRQRTAVQVIRIPCLGASGREGEIAAAYAEAAAADPRNPMVRVVGVLVAFAAGDPPEAGRRLAGLAEEDPDALSRVTGTLARGLLQALTEKRAIAERDRLFIALARADWRPSDRPELRDGIAQGAIEALLADARADEARTLLPRITAPEVLAGMATVRLFEPLWPVIEARLGPHADAAVDRYAAPRLDAFASHPDDADARRDATRALILLGRLADAAATAEQVTLDARIGEADVATVRYGARALAAQGDTPAAVARLRALVAVGVERVPAVAAGVIGLAELLDESDRAEEALAVAQGALAGGGRDLSDWGRGWLRRTEICALAALGRDAEARPLGDALKAAAAQNHAAAVEALLCLGRHGEAATLAIAALATRDGVRLLADQFQPEGVLWATGPSRLRALWLALRTRPDVRAAFDRVARVLPQPLWPGRTPRAVPRIARPDDLPVT